MKKQMCRNYASKGTCEFGKNCRFLHVIQTPLLDPPRWIFSHYKETQEFSPEEVRAFYYDSRMSNQEEQFAKEHDKIWINNYKILCDDINLLGENVEVVSDSDRSVDVRQNPEIFNRLFYPELLNIEPVVKPKTVEPMIIEEKNEFVGRSYNRESYDGRRNDNYAKRNEGGKYENGKYEGGKYEGYKQSEEFYKGRNENYVRRRDDHRSYDTGRQSTPDKRWNSDDHRGFDKGRQGDHYEGHRRQSEEPKDLRPYTQKGKFSYTPTNKFDDRNNVYGKGYKGQEKQPANVAYDRYGNVVDKNRNKKNLDSLFDDEKPNTYFKK